MITSTKQTTQYHMETYESTVQKLHGSQHDAFEKIADLSRWDAFKDKLPQDKIRDLTCDVDTCSFTVDPVGRVTLRIVDREPDKTVKFGADNLPVAFNLWIQLKENALGETLMKITLKADLPFMLKTMLGSKLQQGVTQMAEMLARVL